LVIKVDTVILYYYWRQYDRAIEQCKKALEMDDGFRLAHICLGRVYEEKHMDKEAVDEALKARSLHGDNTETLDALRDAFATGGLKGYFQEAAGLAKAEAKKGPVGEFSVASVYAVLGRKDEAFAALDLAYQQKDVTLVTLNVDPRFTSLHSDIRFTTQVRRIGLYP
ncbi:MAG: tetratricopeptide repeat protein, partial [Blastocatellia bacterium]